MGGKNGRPQKDFIFPSLLRCANTPSGKYKVFLGAGFECALFYLPLVWGLLDSSFFWWKCRYIYLSSIKFYILSKALWPNLKKGLEHKIF